jgi:hypothetical protein
VASKSGQEPSGSTEDIEELLDDVDKTLDRLKTLYEQYFLGIQKQAPNHIHSDVERKLRDLTQLQIRNTGLRYRFASIQAKFAAYNSYWRRTLRQIDNGTYIRNLSKVGRQAARSGADIPEEILAAMPKRMREQVLRDREIAIAAARRHKQVDDDALQAPPHEVPAVRTVPKASNVVQKDDEDFDVDAFFREFETPEPPAAKPPAAKPSEDPKPVVPPLVAPPPPPRAASQPAVSPKPAIPAIPAIPAPPPRASTSPGAGTIPAIPTPPPRASTNSGAGPQTPAAPSPALRPTPSPTGVPVEPIPGTSGPIPVVTDSGPVPRQPTGPVPRPPPRPAPPVSAQSQPTRHTPPPQPEPTLRPPAGMTDADVNALYAKYVKAKEAVGEQAGPGAYGKLLKTINQQAPKIMEQYKAKGVDFSVVVKDNQVIIRAKPKP